MTEAWKSKMPAGRKLVLLALCDNANDQGECYPSISMLVEKCSIGRSSVFEHMAELEKSGAVTKQCRAGRSTIYMIDPSRFCTSPVSAPVQKLDPTRPDFGPTPVQISDPTRPDFGPITIKEPSIEPSSNRKKKAAPAFELPNWINEVHWNAWHSCAKRKKATDQQKLMAVQKLTAWRDAGEDFAGALENAAVGGWQGLFLPEVRTTRLANQPISFAQQDEMARRKRWEEMTGRKWPDNDSRQFDDVIDLAESENPMLTHRAS